MRLLLVLFVLLVVAAAAPWGYAAARFGKLDLCAASAEAYAAEVPRALDELAARHPLSLGLIRGVLNETGDADAAAHAIALEVMRLDLRDAHWSRCYFTLVRVMLSAGRARNEIADEIEQRLGLGH